tara:strand:+ start:20 stop:403 length:384 start_codon:yes stop_codon:yes gene_type:complete
MLQLTFSDQSMVELNSLEQAQQLELMEELSNLSSDILAAAGSRVGSFHRDGKLLHRLRVGELRVYFEHEKNNLHCHYILKKNTFNDFVIRCKLPVGHEKDLEKNQSFWEYLEGLGKKSSSEKHPDKT